MNVSIICPLYDAEKYVMDLDKSIRIQENVNIESIKYVLTESSDNTEKILNSIKAYYIKIKKQDFSHSLTREKVAMKSKGDIIVFITQDIIIKDRLWLYNLIKDIKNNKCEAAFSRQVCDNNSIEKYIRPKNYPPYSRIVSRNDINELGLMTFFFSDASSAIKKDVFIKLNGYDNKNLRISEDMYFAYKLIMSGYRIKYCADSIIIHSHEFTYKQLFKRYFDTGIFFADNKYLLKYNASKSGKELAKSVLIESFRDKNLKVLFGLIPNFAIRFLGMQFGEKYKILFK